MLVRGHTTPIMVTMPIMVVIIAAIDFRESPILTETRDLTVMALGKEIITTISIKMPIGGITTEAMAILGKILTIIRTEIMATSQDPNLSVIIVQAQYMRGIDARRKTTYVGAADWPAIGLPLVVREITVLTPIAVAKILTPIISPVIPIIIGTLTKETEWV